MPALAPDPTYYETELSEQPWYEDKSPRQLQADDARKGSASSAEKYFSELINQFVLVDEYEQIREAIERSKRILALPNNWDGESSERYDVRTWERASTFLRRHAQLARDVNRESTGVPTISPADQGSIDLHWTFPDGQLLINVPRDAGAQGTFFGRSSRGESISGYVDLDNPNPRLLVWLKERK